MCGRVYDKVVPQRLEWQDEDTEEASSSRKELKTVSYAVTHIVLHMELHEPKEDMAGKEFDPKFGKTTACCHRNNKHWKGTGRIFASDSWFGSVKSCVQLLKINGL